MRNEMNETTSCLERTAPSAKGGKRLCRSAAPEQQSAPVRERTARREVRRRQEAESPKSAVQAAIPAWTEEEPAVPRQEEDAPRKRQGVLGHLRAAEGSESPFIILWEVLTTEYRLARRRWRRIVREKKAKRFPESDRPLIQLLLFFWSLGPMAACRLTERALSRRKRNHERLSRVGRWLEGHRLHPAAFLGLACCLAAAVLFCTFYTFGTTVSYDGEVVAVVDSQATAEEVRSDLEQVTARTLGETYTIDDSLLQYSDGLVSRQQVVDQSTLEEDLSQELGVVTSAYCLYVDGELIGATPYEGALEELLSQLQGAATNENTISCTFAEDVEIKQELVPSERIVNLGYLAETLYSTKEEEVTYTVVKGDTWSEIAEEHGMTSKELLAMNPGYDIDKIQIGEVLTLSAAVPYLTMTVVQREHYVEDVMYDIEYTDTADLYQGDYEVISEGQYGAADVVANVTYVNGEETARTVLSSVTLKEPVTEQQLRGTKERPTWLPTGTFRWPTSGRITSTFGGRASPGGIGSTNHKGIDIANSYGTAIYAADGGTVVYAGWMSGYGYLVQINHGNGYVTYYGHNSSLLVSVGQKVYKGQQIARMGSTGNSTGNHCHFEIRYNGVAKNPLNYLP